MIAVYKLLVSVFVLLDRKKHVLQFGDKQTPWPQVDNGTCVWKAFVSCTWREALEWDNGRVI